MSRVWKVWVKILINFSIAKRRIKMESNLHDGFDWTESLAETWTYIVAAKTQAVCGRVLSCNVSNNRHCKEGEYNMWEPTQNGIEFSHSRCFQPMLVVTTAFRMFLPHLWKLYLRFPCCGKSRYVSICEKFEVVWGWSAVWLLWNDRQGLEL